MISDHLLKCLKHGGAMHCSVAESIAIADEIERLREALRWCAKQSEGDEGAIPVYVDEVLGNTGGCPFCGATHPPDGMCIK